MTRFRWITTVALVSLFVVGPALLHSPRFEKPAGVGHMTPVLHGQVFQKESAAVKLTKRLILAEMRLANKTAVHADPGSGGIMPCAEVYEIPDNTVYDQIYIGQGYYLGFVFNAFDIESTYYTGVCFDE